jgi:hypothetical protein
LLNVGLRAGRSTVTDPQRVHGWRCAEHEQGTNTLDRLPWDREVCSGYEADPEHVECRWVRADFGSKDGSDVTP